MLLADKSYGQGMQHSTAERPFYRAFTQNGPNILIHSDLQLGCGRYCHAVEEALPELKTENLRSFKTGGDVVEAGRTHIYCPVLRD